MNMQLHANTFFLNELKPLLWLQSHTSFHIIHKKHIRLPLTLMTGLVYIGSSSSHQDCFISIYFIDDSIHSVTHRPLAHLCICIYLASISLNS